MFYILYPDLQKRHPHWSLFGKWYNYVDLPPGTYWHPSHFKPSFYLRGPEDCPIFPGDLIALVVVLIEDRPQTYYGIPLRHINERVRVLRRVRLAPNYTYEELFQSNLYKQWSVDGTLSEYALSPYSPALPPDKQEKFS